MKTIKCLFHGYDTYNETDEMKSDKTFLRNKLDFHACTMRVYKCGDTRPLFLNSRCEVHALKKVPLISEVDDDCCFSKRQIRAKKDV